MKIIVRDDEGQVRVDMECGFARTILYHGIALDAEQLFDLLNGIKGNTIKQVEFQKD